jgi:hypothetical protein
MICKSGDTKLIYNSGKEGTLENSSGRVPRLSFGDLPPNTLLTADEVAAWLQVARRQVQRLEIPWIDLGRKTPRYRVKDIVAWLETRRREGGQRRP